MKVKSDITGTYNNRINKMFQIAARVLLTFNNVKHVKHFDDVKYLSLTVVTALILRKGCKLFHKVFFENVILLNHIAFMFLVTFAEWKICCGHHCMKSVRTQSFSGLYFPALGLNTER